MSFAQTSHRFSPAPFLQRFAPAFLGWTLVGLFFATRLYFVYEMSEKAISWKQALFWSLLDWYLWALLSLIIFRASRTFALGRGAPPRNLLVHLGLSLLLAIVHSSAYGTAIWIANPLPAETVTVASLVQSLFVGKFHIGVLTYWVLILLRLTFDYHRRYREEELRVSRIEAELARAELQALKMQLRPHFLFNTLNAVSALMHSDVAAAERMLANLSDFLRLTLEQGGVQEVSLKQELEFLKRYLEIEKTRFADRLCVEMDIDPEVLEAQVPNLILQPLVENAIRHGIAAASTAGRISIAAHRENGALRLEVQDDGPGLPQSGASPREGVGLKNTRARLRQLYGSEQSLSLENGRGGGLKVSLRLPFQRSGSDRRGRHSETRSHPRA
jgi:two-component sensor histidine kinase